MFIKKRYRYTSKLAVLDVGRFASWPFWKRNPVSILAENASKLAVSVGAKIQKIIKIYTKTPFFLFLLYFYVTMFQNKWVQIHPLQPEL